ncbi:hypothetical protein PINS_up009871 [Pythium insidiosum]|nr:hypothetical protein PINS_up009871 [Pythium insidiosum]
MPAATRPSARPTRRHGGGGSGGGGGSTATDIERASWNRRSRAVRDADAAAGKAKDKATKSGKATTPSKAPDTTTPLDASSTIAPSQPQPLGGTAPRDAQNDVSGSVDDDELKSEAPEATRRQQRVRCLNVKTSVLPDLLVPYLYGDRQNRIGSIMERTGSTIDYCPLSPEEQVQSPPNATYTMSFLVSAESATQLDSACVMLRSLVERLQHHVQQKLTASGLRRHSESVRTPPHRAHAEVPSMDQQVPPARAIPDDSVMENVYADPFVKTEPVFYEDVYPRAYDVPLRRLRPVRYDVEWASEFDPDVQWVRGRSPTYDRFAHPMPHPPLVRRVFVDDEGYPVYSSYLSPAMRRSPRYVATTPNQVHHTGYSGATASPSSFSEHLPYQRDIYRPPQVNMEATHAFTVHENERYYQTRRGRKRPLTSMASAEPSDHLRPANFRRGPVIPDPYSEDESSFSEDFGVGTDLAQDCVEARVDSTVKPDAVCEVNEPPVDSFRHNQEPSETTQTGSPTLTSVNNQLRQSGDEGDRECPRSPCTNQHVDGLSIQSPQLSVPPKEQDADVSSGSDTEVCKVKALDAVPAGGERSGKVPSSLGRSNSSDGDGVVISTSELPEVDATAQRSPIPVSESRDIKSGTPCDVISTTTQPLRGKLKKRSMRVNQELFRAISACCSVDGARATSLKRLQRACKRLRKLQHQSLRHVHLQEIFDQVIGLLTRVIVHESLSVETRQCVTNALDPLLQVRTGGVDYLGQLKMFRDLINRFAANTAKAPADTKSVPSKFSSPDGSKSADKEVPKQPNAFSPLDGERRSVKSEAEANVKPEILIRRASEDDAGFVLSFMDEVDLTQHTQSIVMASAQRRLVKEISRSDPYYYLHPVKLTEGAVVDTSSCQYGCRGISAVKWERKVVSQISSRMKWFDSVAYSLAKVCGGKELLSRKKMNSTIRKLHLVALQLHCLVCHLYCVRKKGACREIDSLPTALNNSYYEKRMNGYKSRLKLTLHQQQPQGAAPEELMRDTFEFFPELLLCVDVWGYDFRLNGSDLEKLPVEFFKRLSLKTIDFTKDENGHLQDICDELLSILCLWNDFKWGESLESLTVDCVVEFETKVKQSIRKILKTHALHLMGLWSTRILAHPQSLQVIRLTQSNVYYSEASPTDEASIKLEESAKPGEAAAAAQTPSQSTDSSMKTSSEGNQSSPHQQSWSSSPFKAQDMLAWTENQRDSHCLQWDEVYRLRQLTSDQSDAADRFQLDSVSPANAGAGRVPSECILRGIFKSRTFMKDIISVSEKLALHSFAHQMTAGGDAMSPSLFGDIESMSDESGEDDFLDAALKANYFPRETEDADNQRSEPKDEGIVPEVKDLLAIVTSTNADVRELCNQRARSARVRDKLQSQSIELARQSVHVLRTVLESTTHA